MENLILEKTKSTPYINFDQSENRLVFQGESFPENAAKFYVSVLDWIKEYLDCMENHKVSVEFEIVYFNSSTSKVFMTIFDMLQDAVNLGKNISVIWKCDENNETAQECGEEFKEDLDSLTFDIVLV